MGNRSVGEEEYGYLEMAVNIPSVQGLYCYIALSTLYIKPSSSDYMLIG